MGDHGPGHHLATLRDLGLGRADAPADGQATGAAGQRLPRHRRADVLDAQMDVRERPSPSGTSTCTAQPVVVSRSDARKRPCTNAGAVAVPGFGVCLDYSLGGIDADVAEPNGSRVGYVAAPPGL